MLERRWRSGALARRLYVRIYLALLGSLAIVLVIAFGGSTHALIPLFAIGVFLCFTLSQAGMVRHWLRERGPQCLLGQQEPPVLLLQDSFPTARPTFQSGALRLRVFGPRVTGPIDAEGKARHVPLTLEIKPEPERSPFGED